MTREDELLDMRQTAALLKSGNRVLYRLVRDKYADLSGIGVARIPGRWNLPGQEAIYTGTNSSTVQLEKLAHTPKSQVPSNLVMMQIHFAGIWSKVDRRETAEPDAGSVWEDRSTGAILLVYRSLAAAPDSRSGVFHQLHSPATRNLVAIALPSVLDLQWNVVLFPKVAQFKEHVAMGSVAPFSFDERLFPIDATKAG